MFEKLHEAEEALRAAEQGSRDHRTTLLRRADAFKEKQAAIDRRLLSITNSDTSERATELLETSIKKLQNLDIAVGYVELLKEVDDLRYSAQLLGFRSSLTEILPKHTS